MSTRLPALSLRLLVFELLIISVFAVYGMREYLRFGYNFVLHGNEAQWLTSSAQYASATMERYGYIPLWQPYLSRGEPTFDSPFSFALSPLGALPSILLGYPSGIQITIVLSAVLAGFGGWYLGRVLGFGMAARLLLGVMFAVKGPQHAAITMGYIQLGVTQAYLPWVVASAIAIVKFRQQRYPVVLLAFWITNLFLGGNIYYTLPAIIMAVALMGVHLARRRTADDSSHWIPVIMDYHLLRRMMLALGLTAALAAITFIPVLFNSGYIGRHYPLDGWGLYAPVSAVLFQLFSPALLMETGTWNENYYIYTMPIWFAWVLLLLMFVGFLLPKGEQSSNQWRIWAVGFILFVFFTTWGSGVNAIVGWAYENLPLIGRWRNVNRMLTVTSFWLAVFAALMLDMSWRRFDPATAYARLATANVRVWLRAMPRVLVGGIIILLSLLAMRETVTMRVLYGSVTIESQVVGQAVEWIHNHVDEPMPSVWVKDYYTVTPFLREGVRIAHINADYDPLGMDSTLYPHDLSEAVPEWMILYGEDDRIYWGERGWRAVEEGPRLIEGIPSVWHNPDVLPYAFTISLDNLRTAAASDPLDSRIPTNLMPLVEKVTEYEWQPGSLRFTIENPHFEPQVLVVQEVAWPGWSVRIDGQRARLESIGQLIGVVIPRNSMPVIEFSYDAPLLRFGAIISALTIIFIILYMAQFDTLIVRWRARRFAAANSAPAAIHADDHRT